MNNPLISRRNILKAGAALPLAGAFASATAGPALAGGHAAPAPISNTFKLGGFTVSTLLAGTRSSDDDPQGAFGMNVSKEEFVAASEAAFVPADRGRFFFTPTVVETGNEVVLFDTGLSADGTLAALGAAGYAAGDVDIVVLTHMHGDHIGGMTDGDGAATYPNARYVTGQVEYDHWAGAGNEGFDQKMRPFAEKTTFIDAGQDVVTGITSVNAFGHTPGHMAYRLSSEGRDLLLMADTANHHVWSLAYPDWEVRFDIDKAAAAATRKRVLGMVAADRIPLIGYHMPFPGIGFVEQLADNRFRYVPATYQLML